MPQLAAAEPELRGPQTYPGVRVCICGCDRPLIGRRADAVAYDATCRQRLHRDRQKERTPRKRCHCAPTALAVVDEDGDLRCTMCGRARAHVSPRLTWFDATAREMITDAEGRLLALPHRKRRPGRWRDWQPDPPAPSSPAFPIPCAA